MHIQLTRENITEVKNFLESAYISTTIERRPNGLVRIKFSTPTGICDAMIGDRIIKTDTTFSLFR